MKTRIVRNIILLIIIILLPGQLYAQSDYEIVTGFKEKVVELENSINSANGLEELNALVTEIDRFRNQYRQHKLLLDKSLYPDNFEDSFDRINLAFVIRNRDFTTIDILQTENLQLKEQIIVLNKRNSELMNRIQDIELSAQKDKSKTTELDILVSELKKSLSKRDELIYSLVDSLMPQLMKDKSQLSADDQNKIYIESEKNDLITNIKNSIKENIRFIYMTALKPEDLKDIEKQQDEFFEFWQDAGVKLVDIYSSKKNKSAEISSIDSLYGKWQGAIETAAWINIRQEFAYNHIILIEFYNSHTFTEVLTSYIEDEIRNIGVKSNYESETSYSMFVDSTWNEVIKVKWIPFLVAKEILSGDQKSNIESSINNWSARLSPKSYDWIYFVVILAAVAGLLYMNRRRIFRKKDNLP